MPIFACDGLQGDTLMDVDSPVRDEKIPHSRYTEILDFGKELLVLQRMIPESVRNPIKNCMY